MCISCKLNSFYRKNHQFLLQRYLKLPLLHTTPSLSPIHTHTLTHANQIQQLHTHVHEQLHKVLHTLERANCCELRKEQGGKNKKKTREKRAGNISKFTCCDAACPPLPLVANCHCRACTCILNTFYCHTHTATLWKIHTPTHTLYG